MRHLPGRFAQAARLGHQLQKLHSSVPSRLLAGVLQSAGAAAGAVAVRRMQGKIPIVDAPLVNYSGLCSLL